jgi:hypothetical protein
MEELTWNNIPHTPEGEILKTAVCFLGMVRFQKNKPTEILEFLKELRSGQVGGIEVDTNALMEYAVKKLQSKNK